MTKTKFVALQKHLGSPIVVALDQEGKGLRNRESILIPRKVFGKNEIPEKLKVTVEWDHEE